MTRTVLITGATDGHGLALAGKLAESGAELVLLARDPAKAAAARQKIAARAGGKEPEVLFADLASFRQIDLAVEKFRASGRRLDLLVNNAGLVSLSRQLTEDGFERTFAVNYLAMCRLTFGLLPCLEASRPAKILNVSSDTYRIASLDFDDLQLERDYNLMKAYGVSKLAILYFTLEMAKRLESKGIAVNAVDPGPVASNITGDNRGFLASLARPMIRHLFPSAERAARTAFWVATDPNLPGPKGRSAAGDPLGATGGYYRSMKRRDKPLDFDPRVSEKLFEETQRMLASRP